MPTPGDQCSFQTAVGLLELPLDTCEDPFHSGSAAAIKLLRVVVRLLAATLRRANRRYARLLVEGARVVSEN